MTEIYIPNGQRGYHEVLRHVVRTGVPRQPRGLKTLDAGQVTMILESPHNALPLGTGRGLSRRIAAAEAIQLIGGFSQPKLLPPSFDRFKEDDGTFWGAYGTRIGNQLEHVVQKLKTDRDTRQAVITLWSPQADNVVPPKRDHPCTVALGFDLSSDKLVLRVTMRSSDVWLGIPHDWFQFTQLQLTVANVLQVEPGPYWHTSWSLHIYEENVTSVDDVTEPSAVRFQPSGIGSNNTSDIVTVQHRARGIAHGYYPAICTESERWYLDALKS